MITILWADADEAMFTVDLSATAQFVELTPCDGAGFMLTPAEARQLAEALTMTAAWIEREQHGPQ